ncbi:MAG TPA: ABC transporter substrate-binding protein, partial [Phototrophicaceae bacterium]|nr:ABC transporter substrate-binding protein [Phototrophicaceae bacterium]
MRLLLLLILFTTMTVFPALGQDTAPGTPPAHGPIVEGNSQGGNIQTLNPLFCVDAACRRITSLLFPTLVARDSDFDEFRPAQPNSLAVDWIRSDDGMTYTIMLYDDLTWNDGEPINAYDVFFSYLAIAWKGSGSPYHQSVVDITTALIPLDAKTVVLRLKNPACDDGTLHVAEFPIIPVHRYDPGFADEAAQFLEDKIDGSDTDIDAAYHAWVENESERPTYSLIGSMPESYAPVVTFGDFHYEPGRDNDTHAFRLYAAENVIPDAYVLVDTDGPDDTVDRFINGEINFIADPPVDRRADIEAVPGVQVTKWDGDSAAYISFNLTDPGRKTGEDVPLGDHPLFAEPNVRKAIQLALAMPQLIDIAFQGDAQSLILDLHDLRAAQSLLEAAHWKDT